MDYNNLFVTSTTLLILLNILTSINAAEGTVEYDGHAWVVRYKSFTLKCNTNIFAYIKWLKDGHPIDLQTISYNISDEIETKTKTSILSIPSTDYIHNGHYKCSSDENDYGFNLTVVGVVAVYPEGKTFVTATHRIKFEVECKVNGREKNQTISWVKDNKHLTADDRIHINDNKVEIKLTTEADAGNYVCELRDSKQPLNTAPIASATVVVLYLPKLYVSTEHKDQTFIEETDINITCSSWGKPTTMIWKIGNETYESSRGRVTLHEYNSIPNANLKISNANKTIDRGNYTCYGKSPAGDTNSVSINVRIKGKYAALWPFFGICAEVLLLCAVILIYEKRRDKTELEESDTDQGPETKSSPDHGQDNVRQRK